MKSLSVKSKKNVLVSLCSVVYFVSYFSRKDFAAVMAGMLEAEILERGVAGLIGTALFVCYGVGQLVSGYLGDKMKPRTLIILGLSMTSIANILMPLIKNTVLMIPTWAFNGFAQAMLWPPIVRLLSDNLEHEKFVKANLLVTSAAHISTILLYIYVPVCLEFFSWKTVFFTAGALALFIMVIFTLMLNAVITSDGFKQNKPQSNAVGESSEKSYFALINKTGILWIFIAIIMMGFLRDGIENWLPTLYSEAFNRDASESILVSVALPIFAILSITVVTALHKTSLFKNEVLGSAILFLAVIILALPIVFMIKINTPVFRIICLVLSALVCGCMHGCNFLLISCLPGRFSIFGKAATTSGLCNAFVYVGAAISTYGLALISEIFDWQATIISWIIVAAIGLAFGIMALSSYTKFIKTQD